MHNWCMYETFITQTIVDLCLVLSSSLNYRFSHLNLTCELFPGILMQASASVRFLRFLPYSILDVVAYNCFLEVVPAVVGVFGVTNLGVGHAAHGANVRLDALPLVVRNCYRGQVDGQVFLQGVV